MSLKDRIILQVLFQALYVEMIISKLKSNLCEFLILHDPMSNIYSNIQFDFRELLYNLTL